MTKMLFGAGLAALAATIPAAAPAQRLTPAVIAVVDTARIARECTACRAAQTQLQQQVTQVQTRAQQLGQPLQTESQSIEQALGNLNGRQPDASLQQRIQSFRTQQTTAEQELEASRQRLASTQAHVNQQISTRLAPIINSVMTARGATIALDRGATLGASPTVDVTSEVLTQLNQQLPSVSVTPLPQQAQQAPAQQQQQPQGR
jgi:outer membrane protein